MSEEELASIERILEKLGSRAHVQPPKLKRGNSQRISDLNYKAISGKIEVPKGLLDSLAYGFVNEGEVEALMCHELYHAKYRIISLILPSVLFSLAILFFLSCRKQAPFLILVTLGVLFTIGFVIGYPLSRIREETQADKFSAVTTKEPCNLISALLKIKDRDWKGKEPWKHRFTHLSIEKRIEKLKQTEESMREKRESPNPR